MNTLIDWLQKWCSETPDNPAWWVEQDGRLTSTTWLEVGQCVANLADQLPYPPGERLLSHLPNGVEWAVLDLACQAKGLVHVPIDYRIPSSAIETYREQIQPVAVYQLPRSTFPTAILPDSSELNLTLTVLPSVAKRSITEFSPPSPDIPATILFTSGTNGCPRGVVLSHRNLLHNAMAKFDAVPQSKTDRRLNVLPFSHAYARTCELSTWLLSGSSMLCASGYEEMLRLASLYKPTLLNAVPYIFQKLKDAAESEQAENVDIGAPHPHPLSHKNGRGKMEKLLGGQLRVLASGGAGLSDEVFHYFALLGLPIVQGYGLTEASPVVCSNRLDNPQPDCVGQPIRDTAIRIDEHQRLFVKGPGVMLGYWQDDHATKTKITDGWLDTGDRAEQLPSGAIRILGRCDDQIVLSTGDTIDPSPIEVRLCRLRSIQQAVLLGHEQRFVAAIVVANGADETLLLEQIRMELGDLPDYIVPKRLLVVSDAWKMADGLLNHKGAVIRNAVMQKYRLDIGRIFHRSLGRRQDSLQPSQSDQKSSRSHDQRDDIQQ